METLTIEQQFDQAKELARMGCLADAEIMLEKLSAKHPNNYNITFWIGLVRFEDQKYEAALEPLSASTKAAGDNPYFHYCLGLNLARLHRHADAAKSFQHSVDLDADMFDALFNLSKALKNIGCLDEAAENYALYLDEFPGDLDALYNLGNLLFEQDKLPETRALYEKILVINPSHLDARVNLALVLSQQGFAEHAIETLKSVLETNREYEPAHRLMHSLMNNKIPNWHLDMINDTARNDAYEEAICRAVPEADNILEIGTGSGLLSMMAARAGAKNVVSCEMSAPLASISQQVIADNNYEDQITVLHKKSTNLNIGEDIHAKADLLITEIFDMGLLGENCISTLVHARENLLTENAKIIPAGAILKGFLLSCRNYRNTKQIKTISGFDLSAFDVFRRLDSQPVRLTDFDYTPLSHNFEITNINFKNVTTSVFEKSINVLVSEDGTCDGIVFWFDLLLDDDIVLETQKPNKRSHWLPVLQLFGESRIVKKDQEFIINLHQNLSEFTFLTEPS